MHLNHIHLRVRDLEAAVAWFEKVFQISPGFQNEQMATFGFDPMTLIFDAAKDDVSATVGFESDDCDGAQLPLNPQQTGRGVSGPRTSGGRAN